MELELAKEIIGCLPRGRTMFYYYKDRYAVDMLADYVGAGMKVARVKNSPYARLLERPPVKRLLAERGDGTLDEQPLRMFWPREHRDFLLTLDTWGARKRSWWYQTSRAGYNLVLQLNFPRSHDRMFKRLARPGDHYGLNCPSHPVMRRRDNGMYRSTLAWARIDLDLERNEALIEEIQSDWVREARGLLGSAHWALHQGDKYLDDGWVRGRPRDVLSYVEDGLRRYADGWQEAVMWAAIDFIRRELGIDTIYYHDYETCRKLKNCDPPRSLYAKLPRKFCFRDTQRAPEFLMRDKGFKRVYRRLEKPRWQVLAQ